MTRTDKLTSSTTITTRMNTIYWRTTKTMDGMPILQKADCSLSTWTTTKNSSTTIS